MTALQAEHAIEYRLPPILGGRTSTDKCGDGIFIRLRNHLWMSKQCFDFRSEKERIREVRVVQRPDANGIFHQKELPSGSVEQRESEIARQPGDESFTGMLVGCEDQLYVGVCCRNSDGATEI